MVELILSFKIKETGSIRNLNSRDFRFKNWHATTINLRKNHPPNFIPDINDFKKLTFIDTKYHRGNRFSNPSYDVRYLEDLDSAAAILKKIVTAKKDILPEKETIVKKEETRTIKANKPKKSSAVKKISKAAKPKPSAKAKIGKSTSRPKKQSSGKKKP